MLVKFFALKTKTKIKQINSSAELSQLSIPDLWGNFCHAEGELISIIRQGKFQLSYSTPWIRQSSNPGCYLGRGWANGQVGHTGQNHSVTTVSSLISVSQIVWLQGFALYSLYRPGNSSFLVLNHGWLPGCQKHIKFYVTCQRPFSLLDLPALQYWFGL